LHVTVWLGGLMLGFSSIDFIFIRREHTQASLTAFKLHTVPGFCVELLDSFLWLR
jgi:hypothetical protein